ncbi:MAG: type IV pili methyl-accepting chemotaxis transducer N-terminal domain-containing protein, partial [Burkholderiaceae bacterium]
MRRSWTLAARMGAMGSVLLLMAMLSIGLTLWIAWQLEGGAAAVNEAGRMRMQTWELAQALAVGDPARPGRLLERLENSVSVLRAGDPARPLAVPRDARSQAAFDEVQRDWRTLRTAWSATPPPSMDEVTRGAEAFVGRVDVFVSAIERQLARLTAILNAFQFLMMALTIASAVALLYSAYLFVFNPLARLQAGLARMGGGDLSARVEEPSDDEFGALAQGFNRMAQTLQGLYQNLEAKVQEKTLRLQ